MKGQSLASTHQSSPCAGAWKLAARQAMSLRPRQHGVLRVVRGRLWVTVQGRRGGTLEERGDHVLVAGDQLPVRAHRHVVLEAWSVQDVCFEWQPLPQAAPVALARRQAIAQSTAELRLAGRMAAGALARLAWALVRLGRNACTGRGEGAAWLASAPDRTRPVQG